MTLRRIVCAALGALSIVGAAHAQQLSGPVEVSIPEPRQRLYLPGTAFEVVVGDAWQSSGDHYPTEAMLKALATWISQNANVPFHPDLPKIEFVPPARITALRHHGLSGWQTAGVASAEIGQREVVSVYSFPAKTIYLRDDWTGSTPAELSVLVHEIVHHLQNVGQQKFECPMEREQMAYKAQGLFLDLFGLDLAGEFEIDPFTLLVTTKCFY